MLTHCIWPYNDVCGWLYVAEWSKAVAFHVLTPLYWVYLVEWFCPSTPIEFKQRRAELVLEWVTACELPVCVVTRAKASTVLGVYPKHVKTALPVEGYRGSFPSYPRVPKILSWAPPILI